MRQRKSYPKSFKIQNVQECAQPGVSVAGIAMRHGINANVVRRWIPLHRDQQTVALPAFIPLEVTPVESKQKTEASAIIELPLDRPCSSSRSRILDHVTTQDCSDGTQSLNPMSAILVGREAKKPRLPWQTQHQCLKLLYTQFHLRTVANSRLVELALV
ncbi:IS66-like element accessory protein TnpA [Pseudomonas cichorii]|uniref:IS66-like element accessory protein TnpA n=1 Tax=Pseudomonas cichorii TaxID=36746 RepID=UPI001C896968|nr:transposase [Pseudomonas cichorii]MBX8573812.1 transposase [Pseudomonas cichorii]